MTSGQETEWVYSYNTGACAGLMMEVVVTTGAIGRAKFQWNHHHQQTNTQCFTGWMPFLSPNQRCQSTEEKN